MEEEKYRYSQEEEISRVIQRFEKMKRNNESYFFDVIEFETIIDYYLDRNNQSRAFEAASIASRQHPNSVPIQLRNAKVLLDRGRVLEALRILKKLETIEPGNHEIFVAKGTALGMMGDIQGAIKMFDLALSKDSDDQENILFSITSILQNLNYYEQVIPYLKRLSEFEPDYAAHLYDLAYAYEKIQDYDNSTGYYLKCIDEEPFSDNAWFNLAMVYDRMEKYEEALEAFDFALAINPRNDMALFNKGMVLTVLGRNEEAIPIFHEYLQIDSESFEGMTCLAECYYKTGNTPLAKKYFYEAVELAPEFSDPWTGLGIIELDGGDPDKSLACLRKAAEFDSENPEIWYYTGKAFRLKNNKKQALRSFRESLRLDPFYNEAWYELAKIVIEENQVQRTIPLLVKALKVIGDFPGINYLLATFYLLTGERSLALKYLRTAIDLDADAFKTFRNLFPVPVGDRNISRILKQNNLI